MSRPLTPLKLALLVVVARSARSAGVMMRRVVVATKAAGRMLWCN